MATATRPQSLHSLCDYHSCGEPITITIADGQKWHDVQWQHDDSTVGHRAIPELRFAIDATCPGCKYPEIGFAPHRDEFVCARCGHTSTERPKD